MAMAITAFKNEEVRVYLGIIASATLLITANIFKIYGSFGKAFRYAVFQVASIITTTGFATADYNLWPEFSKCILLTIMVVGACAGSTGGGMKGSRIIIMFKSVWKEIKRMLKPKSVSIVKVNGKKVDIPSYLVKAGDVISVREIKKDSKIIKENAEVNAAKPIPEWLEKNNEKLEAKVIRLASREDVDLPVEEHLIVELYSK